MKFNLSNLKEPAFYFKANCVLFVLPFAYGIASLYCFSISKSFFTTYPDSIYIYLVNGTNIAGGNFDIGHYDNPGTPVHLLAGIIIFISNLFIDNRPVYESVLSNPEVYLKICVTVLGILLLLVVYVSGKLVLKHTGSIIAALLFQLIPICSFFAIHYLLLMRVTPENLIIICLTYYYAFLWVLSYKRDFDPDHAFGKKSHLLFFSFITALLICTKITCLPFCLLPLFFIKKNSEKFFYILLTVIFSAIILFPIWPKLSEMWEWFIRLATHSGAYGAGKEEINTDLILSNLEKLLRFELFFSIGYIILLIAIIAGLIKGKLKRNYFKLIFSFWIICTGQLILSSKQFGYHYLIASQLLIIPGMLATLKMFIHLKTYKTLISCFFIFCLAFFSFKTYEGINNFKLTGNKIQESYLSIKKYSHLPKIITTGYQGSCFPESALRFGASYGGPNYHLSNYFLRKLYPKSYFFDLHLTNNYVKWWDVIITPQELFSRHPEILVYFIRESEETEQNMIKKLSLGFESAVKPKLIKYNTETAEKFYLLKVDTSQTQPRYSEKINLVFDFEKKSIDNAAFVLTRGKYYLGDVPLSSTEKYFSGNRSIKILPDRFACCTTFTVNPGDAFDISAKGFSKKRPLGITLCAPNPIYFDRSSESITESYDNGWKKISLSTIIPEDYPEKEVRFCLYNFDKKDAYADDLNIHWSKSEPVHIKLSKFLLKASNNKYLALAPDSSIIANQTNPEQALTFEKVEIGSGKIALKINNEKFITVDSIQGNKLYVKTGKIGKQEMFEMSFINNIKLSLKSTNGKFVCADFGKNGELIADKDVASTWEIFDVKLK